MTRRERSTNDARWHVAFLVGVAVSLVAAAGAASASSWRSPPPWLSVGGGADSSCAHDGRVSYNTGYDAAQARYVVTTVVLETSRACASHAYVITVQSARRSRLAERSGRLDAGGNVFVDFTSNGVPANAVAGVSSMIVGRRPR